MLEITRGTTPELDILLDNTKIIEDAEITFSQYVNGKTIKVIKRLSKDDGVVMHEGFIRVRLSEEETFSFGVGFCQLQVRVLSVNGNIGGSDAENIKILKCLSEERLTGDN